MSSTVCLPALRCLLIHVELDERSNRVFCARSARFQNMYRKKYDTIDQPGARRHLAHEVANALTRCTDSTARVGINKNNILV